MLDGNSVTSMDLEAIVGKVQNLSDLELATLLCLVAKQHCLIETEEDLVDDVAQELALVGHGHLETEGRRADAFNQIAVDVFNLSYAVLSLDNYESNEAFGYAILDQPSSRLGSLDESAKTAGNVVRCSNSSSWSSRESLSVRLSAALIF